MSQESYPRRSARTARFTLGAPRAFTVAPDDRRVVFLRSSSGTDRTGRLWVLDLDGDASSERLVADPLVLLTGVEELSAEERARRERTRESGAGIVAYAVDSEVRTAAFALSGRLWVADLVTGDVREPSSATPVADPRPDPTGRRVAYVAGAELRVVELDTCADRVLATPDAPEVTWGLAEFVAAEEMERTRGFWWSPDGEHLLAARVDVTPVQRWYVSDPANPETPASEQPYPAAGTPNAHVRLAVLSLDGARTDVEWDVEAFPYLVDVDWGERGAPLVTVQSRDQGRMRVLTLDPVTGRTESRLEQTDPAWVDIVPGLPAWLPDGRLVSSVEGERTRGLAYDGEVVTPPDLQVLAVLAVGADDVLIRAAQEPTEPGVWRVGPDGATTPVAACGGVHTAVAGTGVTVVSTATLERAGAVASVRRGDTFVTTVTSYAEVPPVQPQVRLLTVGARSLRCALLLPTGHRAGTPLPVLMDPYGGPHFQRVLAARSAYLESQWLADQGFAVLVADGRGTPGRGPQWERSVHHELAAVTLEDQVDALHAVAAEQPDLDLQRVGIRGWSYGGYLAALAVLRRPDVFHAAVAGAPVTDLRLYDTHYTERYLGHPDEHPDVYERNSLLGDAHKLSRPLLLIHGLADDNVVVAHTLRLSSALLAAGRPHTVLPLSGVTHMASQPLVAENLLNLQVAFLRDALANPAPAPAPA